MTDRRFQEAKSQYVSRSWCCFPQSESILRWVNWARPYAFDALTLPQNQPWIRQGETWFVGVNALPNDSRAVIDGGPGLEGDAIDFLHQTLGFDEIEWDRAQISVCYPGYPGRSEDESAAAYGYRLRRDAAHVDGLLPEGKARRRHLRELHGFILGIPMTAMHPASAPLVVWEGSHPIIRDHLRKAFADRDPAQWTEVDVTEAYNQARKIVFNTCNRVEVVAKPGEVYLLHRLALHGIAPWQDLGQTEPHRMICYFRPYLNSPESWLSRSARSEIPD